MFALGKIRKKKKKQQLRHASQPLAAVPMENNVKINKKKQFHSD